MFCSCSELFNNAISHFVMGPGLSSASPHFGSKPLLVHQSPKQEENFFLTNEMAHTMERFLSLVGV